MLRDRRVLIEQEIKKFQAEAANMYLSIVVGGDNLDNKEYQQLKETISRLEFDLEMINQLIGEGHE
jgi:hypothetical protein